MAEQLIPCGAAPLLTIRAENNLSIRGGEPSAVQITIEDLRDLSVVDSDGGLRIVCEEDCALRVPADASVVIEEAGGNANINDFGGSLRITKVEGNLTLYRVGEVECKRIDGNCRVEYAGRLAIEGLGGNLKGGQLTGALSANAVGGNIKLAEVAILEDARAGGNIEISLKEIINDIEMTAGGNIRVHLPTKSAFYLDATSGGHNMTVGIGGAARSYTSGTFGMRFGEGGPRVKLTAGGNIALLDSGQERGVETSMEFDWQAMNDRVQRRIDEKIKRSEQRAETERRKAERRVQAAMQKIEALGFSGAIGARPGSQDWQAGVAPQAEPLEESEPVTDAERMLVLNLLQEKKITAEEAERLLDALAGKFD